MIMLDNVYTLSSRGLKAIFMGEKLYDDWSKEELVSEVMRIKARNLPCPNIDYDRLEALPAEILRRVLLKKSSWHHVNRKPEWFYVPDEKWIIGMNGRDIHYMENDASWMEDIENKPRLADFRIPDWRVSDSGREYCRYKLVTGVCYNGIAYFENGYRKEIGKDRCEMVKVYAPVPKHLRKKYDAIRRRMRSFEIYC